MEVDLEGERALVSGWRKNIRNLVPFLESGEALKSVLSLETGSQASELYVTRAADVASA